MSAAEHASARLEPESIERRNFQRVTINVPGRYMLEDRSEHPCVVVDMSPGSAALQADRPGQLGERVIAYIDHIGRVEGVVSRMREDGFALELIATERKKEKLAAQLTWLANKHELGLPEDRRHERIAPRNPHSVLVLPDGVSVNCRLLDLSLSGAAIEIADKPDIGSRVRLGIMNGIVVRHFDEGVAIEFAAIQSPESLEMAFNGDNSSAN